MSQQNQNNSRRRFVTSAMAVGMLPSFVRAQATDANNAEEDITNALEAGNHHAAAVHQLQNDLASRRPETLEGLTTLIGLLAERGLISSAEAEVLLMAAQLIWNHTSFDQLIDGIQELVTQLSQKADSVALALLLIAKDSVVTAVEYVSTNHRTIAHVVGKDYSGGMLTVNGLARFTKDPRILVALGVAGAVVGSTYAIVDERLGR
ncbi:MAG TPA: hypothetical protein VK026_01520 [Paenalcaligenes sp.]|nr:hypothetical protein [Paenalcaligenes sp.]